MISYSISLQDLEFFLLIFVRVASFVVTAPFFGMTNTPNLTKIAFSIFFSSLLYGFVKPQEPVVYETVLGYALIVGKEVLTGLILGLCVNICTHIVSFAGHLVDMNIGLASASEYDPMTRNNSSVSGLFYQYSIMLILFLSGLHEYLIKAFVEAYTLIPVQGAVLHGDKIVNAISVFMTDFINVGFRICLPIFCVLMITNCILGIMAKVAPQMNMFAVGIQIKLLIGLGVMFLTVIMLPYLSDMIFKEMKTMMVLFVEAIMA